MNAVTETTAAGVVQHKNIYSALANAQMHMTAALKSATNPHFKSKYADLSSVKEACFPALNSNGIAIFQPTVDDEKGQFVETIFYHGESDTSIKCRVPLIVQKNDMQGYGSAVTYARRYGLMSLAGIAPDDDDGNAAAKAAPKKEDQQQSKAPSKNDETRKIFENLQKDMRLCQTPADTRSWWKDPEAQALMKKLPSDWVDNLKTQRAELEAELAEIMVEEDSPFEDA